MNMVKSWKVTVLMYRSNQPDKKDLYELDVNAPNEQKLRRLVLDAAHERDQLISEFVAIERT